jgi:hypothetical protein
MNRRSFLQAMTLAAGAACMPWPVPVRYLEDDSHTWAAWREALIQKILKQGYTIRWAELERPIGGYRRASVHVIDETGIPMTLVWLQPWCAEESS